MKRTCFSAGGYYIHDQSGNTEERFAVIAYDVNSRRFVYSARHWNNRSSSYICQLQQGLYV